MPSDLLEATGPRCHPPTVRQPFGLGLKAILVNTPVLSDEAISRETIYSDRVDLILEPPAGIEPATC